MYLGIDCGTQGTKVVLFDPEQTARGQILGRGYAKHPIVSDINGRREQSVAWWIDALKTALH